MPGTLQRLFSGFVCVLIAATVFAQNNRSAVSVNGNDANPCTTVAPCRSFSAALLVTVPGGEVIAVDSGGYGPFGVTQSVSVTGAPGVYAAITAPSTAINIGAGATDKVVIRNLNITIAGAGGIEGIIGQSCGVLTIENCIVKGGTNGIYIAGSAPISVTIADTSVSFASGDGFFLQNRVSLIRCRADNNGGSGIQIQDGAVADGAVSAVDFASVFNNNGAFVFCATAAHNVSLNLDRALVANNTSGGIYTNGIAGTCAVRITNSMVTDNRVGYGLSQAGSSQLISAGNNLIYGHNSGNTNGTITSAIMH